MDCHIFGKECYVVLQGTVTGLLVGGVYALIALGIVIINKASGVFNFAHGFMMLIGGLIFWSLFQSQPFSPLLAVLLSGAILVMLARGVQWPATWSRGRVVVVIAVAWAIICAGLIQTDNILIRAVIGTALGSALMGLVIERLTIRPLIGQPLFTSVMMTLAVGEVMIGFSQITWGSADKPLPVFATVNDFGLPQSLPPIRIENILGGALIVKVELLIAFGLAMAAFVAFMLFFNYTTLGLAMRATSENPDLAQAVGLRVRTILAAAWAIAGVLAAVAGVLHGGSTGISLTMAGLALRAFPAVLLGGLESVGGAVVGGLVIGVVEKLGTTLFTSDVGEQLMPFLVLMIVLIIKPDGLFGQKRIERI